MGRLAALLVLPLLIPVSAYAQALDLSRGGPIAITAEDGIEWRQVEQQVIARGKARAVRENVTVTADRLIAWYRKKGTTGAPTGAPAGSQPIKPPIGADADSSGNEVYRFQAEGNVLIFTETDQAYGDKATYDIDQAVMVMTGRDLKLITQNEVLTARDSLEYWAQKHMAVARGNAVVVTNDAKRLAADTLVAYTSEAPAAPPSGPKPAGARSAEPSTAQSGKLEKMEAFGNVSIRTPTDFVTGDRGVYVPDIGIARLGGQVRITRGETQLNGSGADVNMKTGVARLTSDRGSRVQGLVVPGDQSTQDLPLDAPQAARPGAKR
jgi:lipopolysaccharide export system protein LptA